MRVAESRAPQASRPDWAGFAFFTVALSSLVYGLIESNQRSFTDGLVLGRFAAAAALLAVFVTVERRSAHPMFDLSLFRLPAFSGGSVAAFGLSASIFAMILYLVLYLQDILPDISQFELVDPAPAGHLDPCACCRTDGRRAVVVRPFRRPAAGVRRDARVRGGRADGLPLRRCVRLGRFLVRDGSAAQPRVHVFLLWGSLWGCRCCS
jgi:hypothetical protein